MIDAQERKRLEAAGYVVHDDVADWLGMDEVERKRLDLHLKAGNAVRRLRTHAGLTQAELAVRMETSRPRITDIELGVGRVSFDVIIRALFALGGGLESIEKLGYPLTAEEKTDRVSKPRRKPAKGR